MREILFRGKRKDNGEWVEGYLVGSYLGSFWIDNTAISGVAELPLIRPETVGQYTGLQDKNGQRIFEGDIVRYNTFDGFDCYSVVKIGEYTQDGSGGEYNGQNCLGVYVEVDSFTCPDWADNDPTYFSKYLEQQNLTEVSAECEIIGNIHDNPELLEGGTDHAE